MVGMGEHDEFENRYAPKFELMLSESGVIVNYRRDRAGVDTGLHLFARHDKVPPKGGTQATWRPTVSRVWFQLKGIHATTLSASDYQSANDVVLKIRIDHLKFWFAAPEPVYLVVYVESVDTFLGIDVQDLVERQWGQAFHASMRGREGQVRVRVPTSATMDAERISGLVKHRSMRIDGPAFRGRPLGHRLDPLRSVILPPDPTVWTGLVERILQVHGFREDARHQAGRLTVLHGKIAQTLMWQSPAFAQFGYDEYDDVRDEPLIEQSFGDVCIILDEAKERPGFSVEEQAAIDKYLATAADNGLGGLVFLRARDRSGTGGLWRSTARRQSWSSSEGDWHQLGLEAQTSLVLTATLVYVEYAPDLDWEVANYLA